MAQDRFGSYVYSVERLVNLIQTFPLEADREQEPAAASDALLVTVDQYSDHASEVFEFLIGQRSDEATVDRIFALAAGDFRLAASLVVLDEPSAEGLAPETDDSALLEELRVELADLRADMAEVTAAVRGEGDDPEGEGGPGGPTLNPNPSAPQAVIPPLSGSSFQIRIGLEGFAVRSLLESDETESPPFVSGGAPNPPPPTERVTAEIDDILDKAAAQISDLLVGGIPLAGGAFLEFTRFLGGELGPWYDKLHDELGGWANRAKRAAVKLLYEGLEKLLRILRTALPADVISTTNRGLLELATWLTSLTLTGKAREGLDYILSTNSLKTDVAVIFSALTDEQAGRRADRVWVIGRTYRATKFPVGHGRLALRGFRFVKAQHWAPPWTEIGEGCAILALCGISAWIAQDSLDHPSVWFVPSCRQGVRSAVETPA